MKNKRIIWMLTAGLTFGMLTGCGGEEKKTVMSQDHEGLDARPDSPLT